MPFTVSHAVVALPFARTPVPAAAVAIGAMAPDIPLFFPGLAYETTHGIPGFLWTTLPLAAVAFALWRGVLRPAVRELVPAPVAERLPVAWSSSARGTPNRLRTSRDTGWPTTPRGLALILVGLVIGILSHIVWDLFTHADRLGSELVPALAEQWGPLPGTAWLQYASGVLGLAALIAWGLVWLRRAPRADAERRLPGRVRLAFAAALLIGAAGAIALALAEHGVPSTTAELRPLVFDAGTSTAATLAVITIVVAAVVTALLARPRPRS